MSVKNYGGDILLDFTSNATTAALGAMAVSGNDLLRDQSLQTAITLSLFSDAREIFDPDFVEEARGWFADNTFGSKLWLLNRSKTEDGILSRVEEAARAALQWMLDDGVVESIDVSAQRLGIRHLQLNVSFTEPSGDGSIRNFKYFYNWVAQLGT
jgi:phage gp46-like protein